MAIPLIVGLGIGAVGLYKSGKAIKDNMDANDINDFAKDVVKKAEIELEISRNECSDTLIDLGQRKVEILGKNVKDFLDVFNQIKNVDFDHDGDLGNLNLKDFDDHIFREITQDVSFVISSGLGAGGGALSGALAAFGAYNGTMAFAAASTGTAISSLSGAAATNATLAWLGGGSLASGGMGVAGGTLALGALAAGPALLVAGWYMGAKAESKLTEAMINKVQAEKFKSDMDSAIILTNGIRNVANMAYEILSNLRKHARRNLNQLRDVIGKQGVDYSQFSEDSKMIVLKNVKIMQVIKVAIDTAILDHDGNLLGDASSNLIHIHNCIENDFKGSLKE